MKAVNVPANERSLSVESEFALPFRFVYLAANGAFQTDAYVNWP